MALPEDCARSFELQGVLGEGGFGAVYRCRHLTLDSPAAVKVMRSEHAGAADQVERFVREARVMAAFKHPHIVGVLDAGAATDPWIAFELIEGQSLESRLERGPLGLPEVLELGIQLASALEHAHAHGVVHRDVKPANVLQAGDGWKLADFGIAHTDVGKTLTAAGTILGTPAYIDPLYVQSGEASPANDIYALAAVLYEALCGVRAIPGDDPGTLVRNAVTVVPVPASRHVPQVPPGLDELLARTLAKTAAARPPSAAALRAELERVREAPAAEPAPAGAPSRGQATASSPTRALGASARYHPDAAAVTRAVAPAAPPGNARRAPLLALAAGALALAGFAVWPSAPRPSPSPTATATPAFAFLLELGKIRGDLSACQKTMKKGQLIHNVGAETVLNADDVEPELAKLAVRLIDAAERARDANAPLSEWAWLANLVYDFCETMRYFPKPPAPTGRLGLALARLERFRHPVFTNLATTSIRCVLLPARRSEAAAAEACEQAYQQIVASEDGWVDAGERAGFLVVLSWRQHHHERRVAAPAAARPEPRRRILAHGAELVDRGSRVPGAFGGIRAALSLTAQVAAEDPALKELATRAAIAHERAGAE